MCERWSSLVVKVMEQVLQGNIRGFEAILTSFLFSLVALRVVETWMKRLGVNVPRYKLGRGRG